MSDPFVSVDIMIKGRFRLVDVPHTPLLGAGSLHAGSATLREEAMTRHSDALMRFLLEMDRKLDSILSLLQRESLLADFPGEGRIVRLGGSGLVCECRQTLDIGQYAEMLLLFEELPLRFLSVMARVEAHRPGSPADPASHVYDMSYTCPREEDREGIVRFLFSEQRRSIRRQKSGEENTEAPDQGTPGPEQQ